MAHHLDAAVCETQQQATILDPAPAASAQVPVGPCTPAVPSQTAPAMTVEATKEGPDVLALATVLDKELEAAKLQDTVDQKPASKAVAKVKKTVPKAKQPAAKKSVAPKPKATSKKKTVASKQVDKGSSATDTKALRDKKHQQQLLSLGVPRRLLSKRDQGCGKCRHRRWCTAAAGSSVASCSFNLF